MSTKLELLGNLVAKVNVLVIGGAMANTFLAAQGDRGRQVAAGSRDARAPRCDILARRKAAGCEIVLPTDAVVARELKPNVRDADRGDRRGAGRRDDPGCRPRHRRTH